jgi:hypothetical protein
MKDRTHAATKCSPAEALAKGALAGLAGTLAMDLLWYRRYRRDSGEDGFFDWEFAAETTSYDQAGAPAQVGKRVAEGFLQRDLPPASARAMTNGMHWSTGVLWGAVHGIVTTSLSTPRARHGLGTAVTAWATSYATLAPAGLYQPIWKYPPGVLWKDLSAHLVYGLGTGTVFAALANR